MPQALLIWIATGAKVSSTASESTKVPSTTITAATISSTRVGCCEKPVTTAPTFCGLTLCAGCAVTTSNQLALPASQAPDCDAATGPPVPYIDRVRSYYQALGYGTPYEWVHFDAVPFQRLPRPLAQCRVALVTTAAPYREQAGNQEPGAPYNAAAKFFAVYSGASTGAVEGRVDLRISHVAIDRQHTTGADMASHFPLAALQRSAASGRIAAVARRFHGAPTLRSQRRTLDVVAPEIVARCQADGADAVILVANCPVCHQTVSLVARALEAQGMATVVMGCARDIVQHIGVPRLLFSDFPLGNAAGRPHDVESQTFTLELALQLLEQAQAARSTLASPLRWSSSSDWKQDYCNIERLSAETIAQRRADFDAAKVLAHQQREE